MTQDFSRLMMGLFAPQPTSTAMTVIGGSTVLDASETDSLTSIIKGWCPGGPASLELLYRASRDGWTPAVFHSTCDSSSPTITLVRVQGRPRQTADSIVGGFSSVSWAGDGGQSMSPGAFIFMLKHSCMGGGSRPEKWELIDGEATDAVVRANARGPHFGKGSDLYVVLDGVSGAFRAKPKTYNIPAGSPYLGLDQRRVVELEVFRLHADAKSSLSAAKRPPSPRGSNPSRARHMAGVNRKEMSGTQHWARADERGAARMREAGASDNALRSPSGMTVVGGSTVLEAREIDLHTATIKGWCPGEPEGLELLYRASRDGWTAAAFHAKCSSSSPTITLVRVQALHSTAEDSIVGGFSSVSWSDRRGRCPSPGAFIFVVKDTPPSGLGSFQPMRWGVKDDNAGNAVNCSSYLGPAFGGDDLHVCWNDTTGYIWTDSSTYDVPAGSTYLELCGRHIVDFEIFRVCPRVSTFLSGAKRPPSPRSSKPGRVRHAVGARWTEAAATQGWGKANEREGAKPQPRSRIGMAVVGGSTVFEASDIGPLTAVIKSWCPGEPEGLELLYRASRDDWTPAAFHAKCDSSTPTISLVRVKARQTTAPDSVVGGFSNVSWCASKGRCASPGAFIFMLKDGSSSGSRYFQPVKWGVKDSNAGDALWISNDEGPAFGIDDLCVHLDCMESVLLTGSSTYDVPAGSPYLELGLCGGAMVDFEVFRVCHRVSTSLPGAKRPHSPRDSRMSHAAQTEEARWSEAATQRWWKGNGRSAFRGGYYNGIAPCLPTGMTVTGGSTVLEASEMNRLTPTIKGWCPGEPESLELLYRASRDGWTPAAFHARCNTSSPTITLVRIWVPSGRAPDSVVVGGYSSVSWSDLRGYRTSPGAFIFMLKDDGSSGSESFKPTKWGVKDESAGDAVCSFSGPSFGHNDLYVFSSNNKRSILVGSSVYGVPAGSPFLRLYGRSVTDFEVFRVCSRVSSSLPAAKRPPGTRGSRISRATQTGESTWSEISATQVWRETNTRSDPRMVRYNQNEARTSGDKRYSPSGMAVMGGSTVLEASEKDLLTATIKGWCPGEPEGLELLYRASRDGWSAAAFHAKCDSSSPTITLVRVPAFGKAVDSVVGGFSSVSWSDHYGSCALPEAFIFMLKDGSSHGSGSFQPTRWGVKDGKAHQAVLLSSMSGPDFGSDLRVLSFDTNGYLLVGSSTYNIPAASPYLALDSRPIADFEVFRVCSKATMPPPTAVSLRTLPARRNRDKRISSITTQGSTLLLVARAAAKGDARSIVDALQTVPQGEQQEKTSLSLAKAIGQSVDEWFPPETGVERPPVGPPSRRTEKALGLIASGEWVKARSILAAIVQETCTKKGAQISPTTPSEANPREVDPSAVYALTFCDHKIGGGSSGATNQQLDDLAARDRDLWPESPADRRHPDARAFPLGALVRAHLLAALAPPSSQQQNPGEDRARSATATPTQDPKALSCVFAVSFLRAPSNARDVGKVSSREWEATAEGLVREHGGSLATKLLGKAGSGIADKSGMRGTQSCGAGGGSDEVVTKWRRLREKCPSEAMDTLLEMSGLYTIKNDCLSVANLAIVNKECGRDPANGSFNIRLEGNPGTGKTTVARLYYRLLKDLGVFAAAEERAHDARVAEEAAAKQEAEAAERVRQEEERRVYESAGLPYTPPTQAKQASPSAVGKMTPSLPSGFVETTGADLANKGVSRLKEMLEGIRKAGGGVLFVDEAYTLEPQAGGVGKEVLEFLLAEIENRRGELVVAFAGYAKQMEALFEFNEGLPSRFPKLWKFEDYNDEVLLNIFKGLMENNVGLKKLRFDPTIKDKDRWARVAITRLGRKRGTTGFGNGRAVRSLFNEVMQRQADRVGGDGGDEIDKFELRKSDLLGTSVACLEDSKDWRTLRDMIGLNSVKEAVRALAQVVETNRVLEEDGKPPRNIALNRCMLGNPGTGKTTVAKLFAGILADLGLLSKGEVVLKTASDFVGSVIGESETKTRAILRRSEGRVLVIDEAYSLGAAGGVGSAKGVDPFRIAVVDTLVEQVQNVPGEDRCVLLLGYRKEMEAFMRGTNPGLDRRFALKNAFIFEDYTDEELLGILHGKLRREHLTAGVDAILAASGVLAERRATASHFGNGGEVANLLSEAKLRKEKRGDGSMKSRLDTELLPQDFDPEYGGGPPDAATLEDKLFGDLVGCDSIKLQLRTIRSSLIHANSIGVDRSEVVSMNFRFIGAPGTGKTTVAGRVGRMFKQLGAIQSDEVVACCPADFTTGYVGQAGIKTKEIMNTGIGKVLFIDEAYGLNPSHGGGGASFMQEAVDQLVQCLTDDKYKGKMVVVVAGYEHEIDKLMESNPGLASRFPDTIHFENFSVDDCCRLLESSLKNKYNTELTSEATVVLRELLLPMVQAPRFSNGRSIIGLAKRVFTEISSRLDEDGSTGGRSGIQDSAKASAEDIRRATSAALDQMTRRVDKAQRITQLSKAPRFGNGRSIIDLLKRFFMRIARRNRNNGGGGGRGGNRNDELGSTDDFRRAGVNTAVGANVTFGTGGQTALNAPKVSTKTTTTVAPPGKASDTERTTVNYNEGERDPFLSTDELELLKKMCKVAGVDMDSPISALQDSEGLRKVFQLSSGRGGAGFSGQDTQAFMRRVVADRAALDRIGQKAARIATRLASDEADAKAQLAEAEAELAKEQRDGKGDLLERLKRAKGVKELALQKAREERERKEALEKATQAALQRMGVCPAGFKWHRQGAGWRCAGGSHYVAEGAVAAEMGHDII